MSVTVIQKLKLQAIWSDLGFLSDEKLSSDDKIAKIDDFDAKAKTFIPDDNARAEAMSEIMAMGQEAVRSGAVKVEVKK